MFSLKIIKSFVITFLFFLLVLTHFSGTVTGDEEKVYNFIDSFLRSKNNFIAWINDPIQNCEIWNKCHSAFLKHNLGWFFFNLLFFKVSELLFFFRDFINDRVLVELSLSFFNTSLFFLSLDGTYRAMGCKERDNLNPQFTDHCFTGDYPTQLIDMEQGNVSKQYSLLTEKN